jgi:hypothetical protein
VDASRRGRNFGEASAGAQAILEELRKQTRLLESIEEKTGLASELLAALTEMQLASSRLPDHLLPIADDGACPRCSCLKVTIPDEPDRTNLRDCRECGHAWRVRRDGEAAVEDVTESTL